MRQLKELPRFIVDVMLGDLARKLRLLGFDAVYVNLPDKELIGRAIREGRVIITRDTGIAASKAAARAGIIFIKKHFNDPQSQLKYVIKELAKKGYLPEKPEARCSVCNLKLIRIKKQSAAASVPSYVFLKTPGDFAVCPGCLRRYWQGTHYARFSSDLQKIVERCKKEVSDQ